MSPHPQALHRTIGPAGLACALAIVAYALATLPALGDFPLMSQDEPWIAAPAAKLATQGVYGNDLFTGYYGMERRTYNFPPLFPASLAVVFRLLGVGAWQARSVAVLFGAATLALTYALGQRLYSSAVGAVAAWLLVGLRLTIEPAASGVPLLDLARIARYDIAVPPLMLATLLAFVMADAHPPAAPGGTQVMAGPPLAQLRRHWRYFVSGVLGGMACLAHVYGGAVLVLIGTLLLWRHGHRLLRHPAPYLIAAGWALAVLPWALYIAGEPALHQGQMLPEQTRLHFWEPAFYRDSLRREPDRYARFMYENQRPVLWPRLGIWIAVIGLPIALGLQLVRTLRHDSRATAWQTPDRLLLLGGPLAALLLALLVNLKFYNYIAVLLPFGALNLALLAVLAWRRAGLLPQPGQIIARAAMCVLLALAGLEGLAGIRHGLRSAAAASSYQAYTDRVAAAIPPGARILALHQFWFGVYPHQYEYRSMVLPFYLSDARTYQPAPLSMERALEQIAPEYILVDQAIAPELQLGRARDTIADERWRSFRRYMDRRQAHVIAHIADPSYGELLIYRLMP